MEVANQYPRCGFAGGGAVAIVRCPGYEAASVPPLFPPWTQRARARPGACWPAMTSCRYLDAQPSTLGWVTACRHPRWSPGWRSG